MAGRFAPSAFSSTNPSILLRAMSSVEWLGAAVSPIHKSRKERRPPASLFRKDFMASKIRRILSGWKQLDASRSKSIIKIVNSAAVRRSAP